VGEVLGGRYELVDVLGSGGAGTVWRVWDHRERAYRAAKVLRQSDGDSLLRFVRETSRQIDHPHVVAPSSWSGEDHQVLFAMPLVRGGSLATLVADHGALPVGWVGELLRQALEALQVVHDAGLVHRDVKPANLLLEATGRERPFLYLSDFGAAAQVGAPRLTRTDAVIGTPGYLAPEQRSGADPDPRQDLYALGVVGLELLTGRPPSPDGALPAAPATTGRSAETVAGLVALLRTMTEADPERRPGSAAEALHELERLARADDLALDVDPQNPVEVFDHVPALPDGWTPRGPSGAPQAEGTAPDPHASSASTALLPRRGPAGARPAPSPHGRPVPPAAWLLAAIGVLLVVLAVLVET